MVTKYPRLIRVIFGPTSVPIDEFEKNNHELASVKFLVKNKDANAADKGDYIYYDRVSIARTPRFVSESRLTRLLDECIRDPICYFLAERDRTDLFEGAFLACDRIAEYLSYAMVVHDTYRPDVVIFHNYPHELFTYIFLKSAFYLKVRALLVHFAVIPWRMRLSYFGDDRSLRSIQNPDRNATNEVDRVLEYYNSLLGKHEDAMPPVDKALKARAGNRYFGIKDELSGIFGSGLIKNVLRIYLKHRSFRGLRKARTKQPSGPYVAFFMHYQPEESTLPRGGLFSQQTIAIAKLRSMLPRSVNIVIKEHPSMYRYPHTLSIAVRSEEFYRNISRIDGVYLVPQETESFGLIDGSLAVATITGTVAIEALARGKQVICFGQPYYKNFRGVTCIEDLNDNAATAMNFKEHLGLDTRDDLINEISYSFGEAPSPDSSNANAQNEATRVAYRYVLAHIHEIAGLGKDPAFERKLS